MSFASTASTVGLTLLALFGTAATVLVQHVMDPCNLVFPFVVSNSECEDILRAGIASSKNPEAAELVFFIMNTVRVEGAIAVAVAVSSWYALTLPFEARRSLTLHLAVMCTLIACINGTNAGVGVAFGFNAFVTEQSKTVSLGIMGVFAFTASCLWVGFWAKAPDEKASKD
ncbi:hypothetical protein T484DRAFT_1836080 [Baffinella frigidus]|nr:hypothetical protein T484DRAFT_1836080 [Cryptophyta sp. CCMP2293]